MWERIAVGHQHQGCWWQGGITTSHVVVRCSFIMANVSSTPSYMVMTYCRRFDVLQGIHWRVWPPDCCFFAYNLPQEDLVMAQSMVSTRKLCIFVHGVVNVIRRKLCGCSLKRTRHKSREEYPWEIILLHHLLFSSQA
jgi:hypothetical protein